MATKALTPIDVVMKFSKFVFLSVLLSFTIQAVGQTKVSTQKTDLRAASSMVDQPAQPIEDEKLDENSACTIFSGGFDWSQLKMVITVYSTYKVDPTCNKQEFRVLTLASIKAQLRGIRSSSITVRGGIHRNLMDVNLSPVQDEFYLIGNMRFTPLGQVGINLWDLISSKKPTLQSVISSTYTPFTLDSDIYYIWNIGTLAHQLVSPDGDKYIMLAYTNDVSPHLTRSRLNELWSQLSLPIGWRYESMLLNKTITIRSTNDEGEANKVLFDELSNFYIKYTDN